MKHLERLIKDINYYLEGLGYDQFDRPIVVGACMLAMQDGLNPDFTPDSDAVNEILQSVQAVMKRKGLLKTQQKRLLTHVEVVLKRAYDEQSSLKDIWSLLKKKLAKHINSRNFDLLGEFFRLFVKSDTTKGKKEGQVFSPRSLAKFLVKLADIKVDDVVYDPCCGSGQYVIEAMNTMLSLAPQKLHSDIKSKQLVTVEKEEKIYITALMNMIHHGDGKTNLFYGSCFDSKIVKEVKKRKITKCISNPPFTTRGNSTEIPSIDKFIKHQLSVVKKGGKVIVIVPTSRILRPSKEMKSILQTYHIEGIIKLDRRKTFYKVNHSVCILIIKNTKAYKTNKIRYFYNTVVDFTEDMAPKKMENAVNKLMRLYKNAEQYSLDQIRIRLYNDPDYSRVKTSHLIKALKSFDELMASVSKSYKKNNWVGPINLQKIIEGWQEISLYDFLELEKGQRGSMLKDISRFYRTSGNGRVIHIKSGNGYNKVEYNRKLSYLFVKKRDSGITIFEPFTVALPLHNGGFFNYMPIEYSMQEPRYMCPLRSRIVPSKLLTSKNNHAFVVLFTILTKALIPEVFGRNRAIGISRKKIEVTKHIKIKVPLTKKGTLDIKELNGIVKLLKNNRRYR